MRIQSQITNQEMLCYILIQIVAGILGVWVAHLMFELPVWQFSEKARSGPAQWLAEIVATFGLLITILGTVKVKKEAVAMAVGLYITAAYWFTASTSFANPAVSIARMLSNTFAGIRPDDVFMFILAQVVGALLALFVFKQLWKVRSSV